MSILTKSFKINFTQVPNNIINDKNVSLKAKGLYLYMVSKPDTWEFSFKGMSSQLLESISTISRIIDELIRFGYMDKINRRNGKKVLTNDYILHETPCFPSDSQNENLKMRISKCESQNEHTSNTIKSNTKKVILNNSLRPERKESDFKSFKREFINTNKGVPFFTKGLGWLNETAFVVNDDEYILNTVSNKLLTREEALKVWKYLFKTI